MIDSYQSTITPLDEIPQGHAFEYVSQQTGVPCATLFLAAASKITRKEFVQKDKIKLDEFSKAACQTENPDILWQIAYVESAFQMRIVQVEGKKILLGDDAENYLKHGLGKKDNVDIGPLQINWRENGSQWKYNPTDFLSGSFSVQFLSKHILKTYVNSCKMSWVACYHSYDKNRGKEYEEKINTSGGVLRRFLSRWL